MTKQLKYKFPFLLVLALLFICCKNEESPSETNDVRNNLQSNILLGMTAENLRDFKWINQPKSFVFEKGTLKAVAEKGTDFFTNPEDNKQTATAPFLFQEVNGDFVARAQVRPDFTSMWNAVALMVHIDDDNWIKFAFENSDATGKSIVSVVTKNVSDDANGVILNEQDQVWLKIVRKDSIYSMLWSKNGNDFKMGRLSTLPSADPIKVGIEFQCPVGDSAMHQIDYFEIEKITVQDLRKGE